MNAGDRDGAIDALRGAAILLVVAFHAHGALAARGLDTSLVQPVAWLLADVRLPLLSAVSGWVYAGRPVAAGSVGPLLRGKARRLLLPFLSWTLLMGLGEAAAGALSPGELTRRLAHGGWHLWYLPALMWLMLATLLLERTRLLARPLGWLLCLGASLLLLPLLGPRAELAALDGAARIAPFFLVGLGLRRFHPTPSGPARGAAALLLLAVLALRCWTWSPYATALDRASVGAAVAGCAAATSLLLLRRPFGPLAALGRRSSAVYLAHFSVVHLAARAVPLAAPAPLALAALLALGVGLPLALPPLLGLVPGLSVLLLGERTGDRVGSSGVLALRGRR